MQAGDRVYFKRSRVSAIVMRELWGYRVVVVTVNTTRRLVVWKWAVRQTYGEEIIWVAR